MADEEMGEENMEETKPKRKKRRKKKKPAFVGEEGVEEEIVEKTVWGEGEEGEEEEEEEYAEEEHMDEAVLEESILTVYDPDDYVSGAVVTPKSTLPEDLFEFQYSFGYDCHKYFNLCACDDTVICWAAGCYITFFDIETKQMWYRRSTTGGTVGALTSYREDPWYRIVIAENRETKTDPVIILYTWPQMEMDAVLRDGTTNAYSVLAFSPDGEYLASIGKEPDNNITIWNWKRHKIMLRTAAFSYDVFSVMFSPYCPGQLTTSGAAHIKFWKMVETFTGLKLKGDLGRFGKTEICDVLGVYPMPDEKVLSGCEWGNVLVWEAGRVKIEVTRKGRKTCHGAAVIQFMLNRANFEITTIARDGCIRVWYWDTVEQADPPEDDLFIEINPVAETCVPGCQIMCLRQRNGFDWYAQDGNGGVWIVDMEVDKLECDHRKVMTCHAGGIVSMIYMRTHPLLITGGADGCLLFYNVDDQILAAKYQYPAPVKCMFYPPVDMDESGSIIMVGFGDGVMRTLYINPDDILELTKMIEVKVTSETSVHDLNAEPTDEMIELVVMISLLKPHSQALTQITINEARTLLVTCGEDSTIFMYQIQLGTPFTLSRIGFIDTPNVIAYMTWKPEEDRVLLLCGQVGLVMEVVLPDLKPRPYPEITTFKLEFDSYRECLVKKRYMRYRPFPEEDDLASLDEEALKARDETGDDEDEEEEEWKGEIQLIESDSMLGTTITWANYCDEGIWVIQKGTGALLLVEPGNNKVLKYAPFPGAWTNDITCLQFICDNRYLMIGTNRGYIRVYRMPTPEEDCPEYHLRMWMLAMTKLMKKLKGRKFKKEEVQPTPRIDFVDYYYLPMHDFYTGAITHFEFSNDGKYLFSCGADGNIFCYLINFEEPLLPQPEVPEEPEYPSVKKVKEPSTLDGELMSHEQLKQKEEYDKMMAIANAHKKRVRDQLNELGVEYNKLIKANKMLPCSQQIDVTLDPRPLEVQEIELETAKALTIRKLAHQLEASDLGLEKMWYRNIVQCDVYPFSLKAIRDPKMIIRPFRQKNLSAEFYEQLEEVLRKMAEAEMKRRPPLDKLVEPEIPRATEFTPRRGAAKRPSWGPPRVASWLLGLPPGQHHVLKKAIRNYFVRLNRHHQQFIEWQEHLSRMPDPNALPPGAAEALRMAEATIGNRVLKTDPDYVAPPGHNTQLRLCLTRQEIYEHKRVFNEKVLELRQHKVYLVNLMKNIGERLNEIRLEIPAANVRTPPAIPEIDEELEFPEKHLEVVPEPIVLRQRPTRKLTSHSIKAALTPYPVPRERKPRVPRFVPLVETKPLQVMWEFIKPRTDVKTTPVEDEIRRRRIHRHLFEQDMLISDAEIAVQKFDARLRQLQRERIRVQERNQLLEIHLCQLHREMDVLNRFEAHEDALAERVYSKLSQVKDVQDQIAECDQRIDDHKTEKEHLDAACQELQREFKKLIQDNKFSDFLRRIFKRKYRPPRDHDDDESESESESSSSSEEEEESLDSRDIGPIRLDPNICPEGCDRELYDKTFEMRNLRHKHEQQMIEQDKLVEILKRDIEAHNKVKRKLMIQLDKRKKVLKDFMQEKQSNLNVIDQVVVLRYDQIRAKAALNCTGPLGLSQTVVFPEKLLLKLRNRVLELQEEIRLQRIRAKINRTHLHRMLIDIKFMLERQKELRAQMRDVLTKKLGKPRKVDKTLDGVLRQMARRHKFHVSLSPVKAVMKQVKEWQRRHSELEKEYMQLLSKGAERLRIATALQHDTLIRSSLDTRKMPGAYDVDDYKRDIIRLKILRGQQIQQIKAIKGEVNSLKIKGAKYCFVPECRPTIAEEEHIELVRIKRTFYKPQHKFFPITPLGSVTEIRTMNTMQIVFDCLDAMRITRDEAESFLSDVTDRIHLITSGEQSRYEVTESIMQDWLARQGRDPNTYKKQTKAFDAIALLINKLLHEREALIETPKDNHAAMQALEEALKEVYNSQDPLENRLGVALATLILTGENTYDIKTAETMTVVVKSLMDDDNPLRAESINKIAISRVISQILDCGVTIPDEDVQEVVELAIECLKAQLITPEEREAIDKEVEETLLAHKVPSGGSGTHRSSVTNVPESVKSVKIVPSTLRKASKTSLMETASKTVTKTSSEQQRDEAQEEDERKLLDDAEKSIIEEVENAQAGLELSEMEPPQEGVAAEPEEVKAAPGEEATQQIVGEAEPVAEGAPPQADGQEQTALQEAGDSAIEKAEIDQPSAEVATAVTTETSKETPLETPADTQAETTMDTPSEAPATPSEAPDTPSEAPIIPSEAPDTPSEAPATPSEAPDTPSEAPDTPSEAPATPSEAPETPTPTPTEADAEGPTLDTFMEASDIKKDEKDDSKSED